MKTCTSYIHEYDLTDDLNATIVETCNILEQASVDYDNLIHKYELVSFFEENVDDEEFITEKEGIFTRIGNGVINLIKKIGEIIKNITTKITGKSDGADKDKATVDVMLARHPEYRNDVIEGIQKEWFTFKDIAKYEKDIVGLTLQLEQHKIDHATFSTKCKLALERFNESAAPIEAVSTTISKLLEALGKIFKELKEGKSSLSNIKKALEKKAKKSNDASGKQVKESTEGDSGIFLACEGVEINDTNIIVKAFTTAVSVIKAAIDKEFQIYDAIVARIKNYLKSKLYKGKDDEEK